MPTAAVVVSVSRVGGLEFNTAAGTFNLAVLGLCAGVTVLPTVFRATGALLDRIIVLVAVWRRTPLPRGFKIQPVLPRETIWEFGALVLIGALCISSLLIVT